MSFILGLLGGGYSKLIIYGGVALAVVAVLFGARRAGYKAAEGAAARRTIAVVHKDRQTRERIEDEIRTTRRDDGVSAADRLLADGSEWRRD